MASSNIFKKEIKSLTFFTDSYSCFISVFNAVEAVMMVEQDF